MPLMEKSRNRVKSTTISLKTFEVFSIENGIGGFLRKQLKVERTTIHFLGIINLLLPLLRLTVNYYYLFSSLSSDETAEKKRRS